VSKGVRDWKKRKTKNKTKNKTKQNKTKQKQKQKQKQKTEGNCERGGYLGVDRNLPGFRFKLEYIPLIWDSCRC
jgi:hypothetical protein